MTDLYEATILADSVTPFGDRLTTMKMVYPRFVHAEHLRHRAFSFSVGSSRAKPSAGVWDQALDNPVRPLHWGTNRRGMQAGEELRGERRDAADGVWLRSRDAAVAAAQILGDDFNVHKQIVNRLIEPFTWTALVVTGNLLGWENFFNLRCHPDAEPHICHVAFLARDAFDAGKPLRLEVGQWHLPFVSWEERQLYQPETLARCSAARCARVSYENFDGKVDVTKDLDLAQRLSDNCHMSPFEHQAHPAEFPRENRHGGNLGNQWVQYRKLFPNEVCRKAPRRTREECNAVFKP
jgi:hypothetical protein